MEGQQVAKDKQDNEDIDASLSNLALIAKVFDNNEGRKLLGLLIQSHGLNGSTQNLDPQILAYNEGKRAIVYELLNALSQDPQEYRKALEASYENQDDL